MTFQAYLDTIKAKTGMDPGDFRAIAEKKGLLAPGVKTGQIVAWLKEDFDLGSGHAMALVATFTARPQDEDRLESQFACPKAHWRATYYLLVTTLEKHGPVGIAPSDSYISLLKGKAKFAIVTFSKDRMDVGIKLKGEDATDRFEPSGSWNAMVTHRVLVTDPDQVDPELLGWLERAYAAA